MEATIELMEQLPAPSLVVGTPSNHLPGSAGKIACLMERWASQQEMFHPGDATYESASSALRADHLAAPAEDDADPDDGDHRSFQIVDEFITRLIDGYIAHGRPFETTDESKPNCGADCLYCMEGEDNERIE